MFTVCDHDQHVISKTLTIVSQSEKPTKQYISVTRFSTIETKSRNIVIPFAVADIKYNIFGTPFSEKYIQNMINQNII